MRLLHVIRSADPAGGGPIEAIVRLGVEQQRCGHDVAILTLDPPTAPWLRSLPLESHALGPVRGHYGYTPRLVPWLRAHRASFQIVIVDGVWQYSSFGVWRALAGTATPYVVFPHGMLDRWFKRRYPLKHLKKLAYWPWGERKVLRDAAAVIYTTETERDLAHASFSYNSHDLVVPLGTVPPPDDAEQQRRAFLEAFPTAVGGRLLLYLGRLHEKKGGDLLIRAFGRLTRRRPGDDLRLIVAGPGGETAYGQALRRLAEAHCPPGTVLWTGALTGDLKWGAFRVADAFVLPSHQENFGMAVVEALACGVPALVSKEVNIWRDVVAGGAGLADTDDIAGTTRLLERWTGLPDADREAMRRAARATFTRFEAGQAAELLAQRLQSIVDAYHDR